VHSDGLRIGGSGFDSRQEQEMFLFSTEFIGFSGPIQPPLRWVVGAVFPEIKRPMRQADYTLPSTSSSEVTNEKAIPPFPHTSSCRGA
jgi:hypothetical protein